MTWYMENIKIEVVDQKQFSVAHETYNGIKT